MISQLNDILENEKENIINDLKELIAVPSVSIKGTAREPFGKNCAAVLNLFLKKAENMGFITKNFDNYAGTVTFSSEKPYLGILCHLDVVPANASEWKTDPFHARIYDGKIFGRGAIDDKGPAAAVLYAMYIIKKSGIKLNKNVRFIIGCDEENGSSDIEYYKTKESFPPYVFTPDGSYPVINFEKGMLRIKFTKKISDKTITSICGGNVVNAVPGYSFIKKNNTKYEFYGISAHASTPELGDNALTKLFSSIGNDISDDIIWSEISELFPYKDNNGKGLGIYAEDETTGETTCVLSMAEIVNGTFCGYADIRFPKNVSLDEICSKIEKNLNNKGFRCEFILKENYHYTDENSEFVKNLLEVYEKETGEKSSPVAIGGGTYVHNIEGGVAFGAEFPGENNNMHSKDEFIKLESLYKNIKLIAGAILKICG